MRKLAVLGLLLASTDVTSEPITVEEGVGSRSTNTCEREHIDSNLDRLLYDNRCRGRHGDLETAWAACMAMSRCIGVTRDNGIKCSGAQLQYEVRAGGLQRKSKSGSKSRTTVSWICRSRVELENIARRDGLRRMCAPKRRTEESALGGAASFAILTVVVDHQPTWQVELVRANREYYTALHGYTNLFVVKSVAEARAALGNPGALGQHRGTGQLLALYLKVELLRVHLPKYDYVVWTDLDVYILDLQRPLTAFTGVMERNGYSVRVSGEEHTKFSPRYQFSNYFYIVRNDAAGHVFADAHLSNITSMLNRCTDISLIDQRSQRIALAATVYSAHGAASHLPNPCAQGQGQVQHCVLMHLCLDYALLQLSSQQPVKNLRSPKPIYFDDVHACGDYDSGLGLQTKQSIFQWYADGSSAVNENDDRRLWLPPLQRAVQRAFSVHWVMSNPFDWDNYIGFFFAHTPENRSRAYWSEHAFPLYHRPDGCQPGAGSTPQCCGNYRASQKSACELYGKRMGDWSEGRRRAERLDRASGQGKGLRRGR